MGVLTGSTATNLAALAGKTALGQPVTVLTWQPEEYNSLRLAVQGIDSLAVPLAGGTMTGALTLSGAPSSNLHAATKLYVDGLISGLGATYYTETEVDGLIAGLDSTYATDSALAAAISSLSSVYQPKDGQLDSLSALSEPPGDRISFWDVSGMGFNWLEVGTGLQIVGTTLSVTGGGSEVGALSDLSDVLLDTPTIGQHFIYNGTKWANRGLLASDIPVITLAKISDAGALAALNTVANAQVASGAAIAYSKLALTASIVNGDIVSMAASKLTGALPAISGASLTALNASELTAGTIPDARFPATLPSLNGSALTNLSATNIATGSLALARIAPLTASRAVVSDGSGLLSAATVTATELGYLSNVTSAIQTQLNAKLASASVGATVQAWDADLDALAALSSTGVAKRTATNTWSVGALSLSDMVAAGSTGYIQYNNGGVPGAEAAFMYDSSTNTLSVDKLTLAANGVLTLGSAVLADTNSGEYLKISPKSATANGGFFIFENDNQANYLGASPPGGHTPGSLADGQAVFSIYARTDPTNNYWNAITRYGANNPDAASPWKPMYETGAEGWYADDGTQTEGRHLYCWDFNKGWAIWHLNEEESADTFQWNGNLTVTIGKLAGDITAAGSLNLLSTHHASANNDTINLKLGPSGSRITAGQYKHVSGAVSLDLGPNTLKFGSAIGTTDISFVRSGAATLAMTGTLNATGLQVGGTAVSLAGHTHTAANVTDFSTAADARIAAAVGVSVQALDADLTALAALDATAGYLVKTAANTYARRTLTGTTNQVSITNGDGTTGNPVLSTPQDIHTSATPRFGALGIGGAAAAGGIKLYGSSSGSLAITVAATAAQPGNNNSPILLSTAGAISFPTGTPDGTKFLRDDGTWQAAAGSGSVATDAIWDAAGDLAVGTGADTAARLAKGTALQYLRTNSGATALEWAAFSILNADINASAAIAYSKLALTGSIVNADIGASAAIAYSKLSLGTSIVNADINGSAAIAYSKLNLATSIVNADVSTSAAIAYSKLNLATSIVNADVSTSAAIAYSKLNLATSILNADVSASAAIAYSKLNLTGAIVNADISSSAAIAISKLASQTVRESILRSVIPGTSGNVWQEPYTISATNDFFGHSVYVFADTATKDALYGYYDVPMNYSTSGTVKVYVIWTSTATTNNVVWEFAYRGVAGDDTTSLDQTTAAETLSVTDAAPGAANRRLITSVTLTASNLAAGGSMEWKLSRDGTSGSDTMAASAYVHGLVFEYTT